MNSGTVIGTEHVRRHRNNQDGSAMGYAAVIDPESKFRENVDFTPNNYFWGVVCDGCSAGSSNEVGAQLLSRFISDKIYDLLSMGLTLENVLEPLYHHCIAYLTSLVNMNHPSKTALRIDFIKSFLMCTAVGIIYNRTNDSAIVFSSGDGTFCFRTRLTDDITHASVNITKMIDEDNKPDYMAYHLLTPYKVFLKDITLEKMDNIKYNFKLPFKTESTPNGVINMSQMTDFIIATDGLDIEKDADVVDILLDRGDKRKPQFKLQSTRMRDSKRFPDDCTVIVGKKMEAK